MPRTVLPSRKVTVPVAKPFPTPDTCAVRMTVTPSVVYYVDDVSVVDVAVAPLTGTVFDTLVALSISPE